MDTVGLDLIKLYDVSMCGQDQYDNSYHGQSPHLDLNHAPMCFAWCHVFCMVLNSLTQYPRAYCTLIQRRLCIAGHGEQPVAQNFSTGLFMNASEFGVWAKNFFGASVVEDLKRMYHPVSASVKPAPVYQAFAPRYSPIFLPISVYMR